MSVAHSDARLFDQCGIANPLQAEYDLDRNESYISLGLITHDDGSAMLPQLGVRPESHFRFFIDGRYSHAAPVGANQPVMFVVESSRIEELARNDSNPILLSEPVTLWRDREPIRAEVHATLQLFRSGPARPSIMIDVTRSINLLGEMSADGYVQVAAISLKPADSAAIESRGQADFKAHVEVRAPNGQLLPASVRRYCRDDDEKDRGWLTQDRGWLTQGTDILEPLDLLPAEGSFRTDRFDIGVAYADLREAIRNRSGRPGGGPLTLELDVTAGLSGGGADLKVPERITEAIEIQGTPSDSVIFSGLCGMTPRRVALAPHALQQSTFDFPPVRARLDRHDRMVVDDVDLLVFADGAPLRVEIKAEVASDTESAELPPETRIVGNSSSEKFSIAVNLLLEEFSASPSRDTRLQITALVAPVDEPDSVARISFQARIAFEREAPQWVICVDFGTSSTALWIGQNGAFDVGHHLRLGNWLAQFDQKHPEAAIWSSTTSISYLVPSYIGLSAEVNLRADFDPLSLGDLTLALPGEDAAKRRLDTLERTYDVSVPFPISTHMQKYLGSIIAEPKRKMILRADHVVLGANVIERTGPGRVKPVRRVDLAKIVEDCFDELGSYAAPSALMYLNSLLDDERPAGQWDASDQRIVAEIIEARMEPRARFGIVVTHPCGIDEPRRDIYRRAGKRFLHGFCGADSARYGEVTLVPEAFAAARYGIEDYYQTDHASLANRTRETFVTLDVGAGTYDVTVIDSDSSAPDRWSVISHFGLAIGGADLDSALVRLVVNVLDHARQQRNVTDAFDIRTRNGDFAALRSTAYQEARRTLAMEFQAAKARLTRALLDEAGEGYTWRRRSDGGPPLEIRVYEHSDSKTEWPVLPRGGSELVREIPGLDATLHFGRTQGGLAIRLRLWREAFEAFSATADGLDTLTELMGTELPNMALAEAARRDRPTRVIVTGRAALWPLLYEKIEQTVAAHTGARMSRPRPFRPEQMKHAVVRGAVNFAREMAWRADSEVSLENPIAIITFKLDVRSPGATGAGRVIDNVELLVEGDKPEGQRTVTINGPFVIARIMPGLNLKEGREKRTKLFQDLYRLNGIKPFVELTRELVHPLPAARGTEKWTVTWRRDLSGLRLVFDCGKPPVIEFGPFGGGRIFAPE